jgi:ankyrin repeat protein
VQDGWTALHWSSSEGFVADAEVLLEKGGGADLAKIKTNVSLDQM